MVCIISSTAQYICLKIFSRIVVLGNWDGYLDNEKPPNKRKYNERCASVINFWPQCDFHSNMKNIQAIILRGTSENGIKRR